MNRLTLTVLLSITALAGCFSDLPPSSETNDGETESSSGDGDGDGDSGDGDGEPGDGDGEPGDGDGDGEPGDGDGEPQCEPGGCPDGEYCVAGQCESPPEGMVAIPYGPFWMGCNEEKDPDCFPNEYPYHQVTLSAYAIDRTEVTAAAYDECVNDGECTPPHTNTPNDNPCETSMGTEPVVCVDWFQARTYCEWQGKLLPTEAQWEKAARGDDGRIFPWGDEAPTCNHAHFQGCDSLGLRFLNPVGSLPAGASPYGALDMAGNALEWCADWYSSSYYLESPDTDPPGPANGTIRNSRGGSYGLAAVGQRVSQRFGFFEVPPTSRDRYTGFRCAYIP
ncbi:MAG: SUMF1/EgtB/PvdO family nonheme iron enzyme [Enhygromyxa sp.]